MSLIYCYFVWGTKLRIIPTMTCGHSFDWNSVFHRLMETFSSNWRENKVKVKVKSTLEQATKAQRWSRGVDLGGRRIIKKKRVVNATPRPLYPLEGPGTHRNVWKYVRSVEVAVRFHMSWACIVLKTRRTSFLRANCIQNGQTLIFVLCQMRLIRSFIIIFSVHLPLRFQTDIVSIIPSHWQHTGVLISP
jgi:hypothetical protein